MTTTQKSFYSSTINVDANNGLPNDYHSFYAAYRPVIIAAAHRMHIPFNDQEDAAQEVAIKFWLKDGLNMYDPERKTKFVTLLRNWSGRFMLQERDKVNKNARFPLIDTQEWATEQEPTADHYTIEESIISQGHIQSWITEAEEILTDKKRAYLIPLLRLCIMAADNSTVPSRAAIADTMNCKVTKATPLLKELRETLSDAGFGMESLYVN